MREEQNHLGYKASKGLELLLCAVGSPPESRDLLKVGQKDCCLTVRAHIYEIWYDKLHHLPPRINKAIAAMARQNEAEMHAARIVAAGAPDKGPGGDTYFYPHTQVDAQVSYWIPRGHGLQAIVSMLNLNNEVFGFYNGSERYPIQREYYSRTISLGLRWTLPTGK